MAKEDYDKCPDIVKKKYVRVFTSSQVQRGRKLVEHTIIFLGSWNIGSLTGNTL